MAACAFTNVLSLVAVSHVSLFNCVGLLAFILEGRSSAGKCPMISFLCWFSLPFILGDLFIVTFCFFLLSLILHPCFFQFLDRSGYFFW